VCTPQSWSHLADMPWRRHQCQRCLQPLLLIWCNMLRVYAEVLVEPVLHQGIHNCNLIRGCCSSCSCRLKHATGSGTQLLGCPLGLLLLLPAVLMCLRRMPVEQLMHSCAGQGCCCCRLGTAMRPHRPMQGAAATAACVGRQRHCGADWAVTAVWAADVPQCCCSR
jgi:hypothetical protein